MISVTIKDERTGETREFRGTRGVVLVEHNDVAEFCTHGGDLRELLKEAIECVDVNESSAN